jgi:LysR family glycine cleavage system transcriptional activator
MSYHLPPLPWLRAFEAAARRGSFAAAAGELALTSAAVSYQVRALEQPCWAIRCSSGCRAACA